MKYRARRDSRPRPRPFLRGCIAVLDWPRRRLAHFHRKLRDREDGVKPSPPRDCKAAPFAREPLSGRVFQGQPDGKAARLRPPSQETGGVLQLRFELALHANLQTGQPSPPARDGRGGNSCEDRIGCSVFRLCPGSASSSHFGSHTPGSPGVRTKHSGAARRADRSQSSHCPGFCCHDRAARTVPPSPANHRSRAGHLQE